MTQYDQTQHVADTAELRDSSSQQKGVRREGCRQLSNQTLTSHGERVHNVDTKDVPTVQIDDRIKQRLQENLVLAQMLMELLGNE